MDYQALHAKPSVLADTLFCSDTLHMQAPRTWRLGCWLLLTGVQPWVTPVPLGTRPRHALQAVLLAAQQVQAQRYGTIA